MKKRTRPISTFSLRTKEMMEHVCTLIKKIPLFSDCTYELIDRFFFVYFNQEQDFLEIHFEEDFNSIDGEYMYLFLKSIELDHQLDKSQIVVSLLECLEGVARSSTQVIGTGMGVFPGYWVSHIAEERGYEFRKDCLNPYVFLEAEHRKDIC